MSESSIGEIHIYITDNEVKYETEMSLPEIVFWAEAIKQMAIRNVLIEGTVNVES
jgi:hypothetical protein